MVDHMMTLFGPDKRHWVPGHEEIELALVKLAQTTGESKYVDFANWLLEQRGHGYGTKGDNSNWDKSYYQDEVPVSEMESIGGHASRIKGARAEGRLQLTNKRILFRAKGTAPVGETTIQHEFSIDEVAGFQIVRNFRFSILDLLLIFALSVAIGYIGVGFGGFLGRTLKAFGQLLVYVLALAVAVPAALSPF